MIDAKVRKITNTGTRKNIGFFPSKKNERPVAFESLLEKGYIHLLEFDNDVISYQEQPLSIIYTFNNRNYKYTPDFLVNRKSRTQIIEIKPEKVWIKISQDEKKVQKYIACNAFCKAKGYQFRIITDTDIYQGDFLKNIEYLFFFSRLNVPATETIDIRNILLNSSSTSIKALLSNLCKSDADKRKYYSYILSLLYFKVLYTDLSTPISKDSIIWA